jgi:adenine-specific DNA-methyltransferase
MVLNYIGSKRKLAPMLIKLMCEKWPDHLEWSLLDAFAGTGAFSVAAATHFDSLYVNDWEHYAYLILKSQFDPPAVLPDIPTECVPFEGYISETYGPPARMFFTADNARLIDGFRRAIGESEYLRACLMCACDQVANIASVYGAYLKQFKPSALATLNVAHVTPSRQRARVTRMDARHAVSSVPAKTIVYLDPPYNKRQYGANYFPLNVIAHTGAELEVRGVTGIPVSGYLKSEWCYRRTARDALLELIVASSGSRVAMSYNDQGILGHQEICDTFRGAGWSVEFVEIPYKRFKADKGVDRPAVTEYLFMASKDFLGPS